MTEEYGKELKWVQDLILAALSKGLGLEGGAMKEALGGDELAMEMKINLYPRCPQPELALGVEAHTDMSAITILVADRRSGLQVWKDGNWVAVDFPPGALVVHVGDQIEVGPKSLFSWTPYESIIFSRLYLSVASAFRRRTKFDISAKKKFSKASRFWKKKIQFNFLRLEEP